jgi:thiol-disulfide isomerase/thioredoxin
MVKRYLLNIGLMFVFFLVSLNILAAKADVSDIEFFDLEGNTVKLSDYQGKWVVVNYWATWCGPCRVEMPELSVFHEAHKDKDAIVLGVNYEETSIKKVNYFLEKNSIQFPVVRPKGGADGRNTAFGPLKGLPTTYIISPQGELVAARSGMIDQNLLESVIKK